MIERVTNERAVYAWIIPVLIVLLLSSVVTADDNPEEKVFRAVIDRDGIQRVSVTGGEYYFDPGHIIVHVNIPVELTFKKTPGITPHNIIIKAPEAGIDIHENMSSEPKTVSFTPTKTGRFEMYCDKRFLFFKSHEEKGMKGILEVVE